MVSMMAPIVQDDQIWIYYGGWNHPYSLDALKRVQEGWIEEGQQMQRSVGLATLPVDGFVSLRAGAETGTLSTKTLRLPGGALFFNAELEGSLRGELRDADGHPLLGFSLGDCVPILSGDRQPGDPMGAGSGAGHPAREGGEDSFRVAPSGCLCLLVRLEHRQMTQTREMWLDRIDGVGCEKRFQVPLPDPRSCLWWSHCGGVPGKVSGKEAVAPKVGCVQLVNEGRREVWVEGIGSPGSGRPPAERV